MFRDGARTATGHPEESLPPDSFHRGRGLEAYDFITRFVLERDAEFFDG